MVLHGGLVEDWHLTMVRGLPFVPLPLVKVAGGGADEHGRWWCEAFVASGNRVHALPVQLLGGCAVPEGSGGGGEGNHPLLGVRRGAEGMLLPETSTEVWGGVGLNLSIHTRTTFPWVVSKWERMCICPHSIHMNDHSLWIRSCCTPDLPRQRSSPWRC